MPFHVFLNKWLKENAFSFSPSTYAEYAYDVRSQIEPFFEKHPIGLLKMSGRDLEAFYRYERQEREASSQELLQYHEIIVAAFQYAVELTWLKENPVAHINPCADEAPMKLLQFLLVCMSPVRVCRRYILLTSLQHPSSASNWVSGCR